MKAEERKEIETNSLVLLIQRWRQQISWRTAYYAVGTIVLITAGVLIYRYFTGESQRARDAIIESLDYADTSEKLKAGIEANRDSGYGSDFKVHLARRLLKEEGLPKLGTDSWTDRNQAGNAIAEAKKYYEELVDEFKKADQVAMMQEALLGAAKAEEALVGMPTTQGGTDSRGDLNKAIEYYEKAGAIFPETEFSKRHKARAELLKSTKDEFVATQKAIYKPVERPLFGSGKDPFGPGFPPIPEGPKLDPSGGFKWPDSKQPELPKIEVPGIPTPPSPEKGPEPRAVEPPKAK